MSFRAQVDDPKCVVRAQVDDLNVSFRAQVECPAAYQMCVAEARKLPPSAPGRPLVLSVDGGVAAIEWAAPAMSGGTVITKMIVQVITI